MRSLRSASLQPGCSVSTFGQVLAACRAEGRPRRTVGFVRNARLHDALRAFAADAAERLSVDASNGAEVPFEVVEQRHARRASLYCYKPLTGAFIDERLSILGGLETYLPAVHALGATIGVSEYLESRGETVPRDPRERAEDALRLFLARVFDDSTDFVLTDLRFETAYTELERVVCEGRTESVVVAPLLGVDLGSEQVDMGDGLVLVRGEALPDAPADADVFAVLSWEAAPGDAAPVEHARIRLRRLLTALRLYDTGVPALGAAAWARTAGGPWQMVVLGATGAPHGLVSVPAAQEDELRAFCTLIGRRTPKAGELAWALRRFELGLERPSPREALSDHLLALRALLEPEGPTSGRLPGRLAALCALPEDRAELAERAAHIVSLERAVIAGLVPEGQDVDALIGELGGHLRALLRDVLCGHLDSDLREVADHLLRSREAPAPAPSGEQVPVNRDEPVDVMDVAFEQRHEHRL
jgi:hypothetical protein